MEHRGAFVLALIACLVAGPLSGCGNTVPAVSPMLPTNAPGRQSDSWMIQDARTTSSGENVLGQTRQNVAVGWGDPKPASATLLQANRGLRPSKASGGLLYVTNFTTQSGLGDVTVYHAMRTNPSPIETITDGIDSPTGDCADADGTLYVANEPISGLGWISEYAPGQTEPSRRITRGINVPAFCAIDADGNLWVTNISGSVVEYAPGSTKPIKVITDGVPDPVGIAFDRAGRMFVANGLGGQGPVINVVIYNPGQNSPSRTISDGVQSPVGITVDAHGTLYVTNIRQNNIEEYRAGKSRPYRSITRAMNLPTAATIVADGWLYVTNDGNWTVVEFPPGSIKPSQRKISRGLDAPEGSAYVP